MALASIGLIEQTEDVEQRALATAGQTNDGVDAAWLKVERNAARAWTRSSSSPR
jgi:hypothetical protein